MQLVQLKYWITTQPGSLGDRAIMSAATATGGVLLGTWAIMVPELTRSAVLKNLKEFYVGKLTAHKAELNPAQRMELDALHQVRRLLKMRNREELPDISVLQEHEYLEGDFIAIVHNLQFRVVAG